MTIYRLEFKRVKGSSTPRLCYFPPDRPDGRCFLPSAVCILKTVKGIDIIQFYSHMSETVVDQAILSNLFFKFIDWMIVVCLTSSGKYYMDK